MIYLFRYFLAPGPGSGFWIRIQKTPESGSETLFLINSYGTYIFTYCDLFTCRVFWTVRVFSWARNSCRSISATKSASRRMRKSRSAVLNKSRFHRNAFFIPPPVHHPTPALRIRIRIHFPFWIRIQDRKLKKNTEKMQSLVSWIRISIEKVAGTRFALKETAGTALPPLLM